MKKLIITAVLTFILVTTASAAPLKPTTLRIGSTGETVKFVQQKLVDLGLSESAVDGKYGRKTAAAVAKFQLSKNLKSDGLVGEKTLAMILASKTPSTNQSTIDSSLLTSDTVPVSRTTKPIIDVPVVIPDVPLSDEVAWRKLCRDRQPHIQVLSPNGGEVYQAGQQVEVKWRSCNTPVGTLVNILINIPSMDWDIGTIQQETVNDGLEVINLPSRNTTSSLPYGTLFKVKVASVSVGDISDNLFTINAPITDMCPNISGVQTTIPAGMIKDSTGNCVQQDSWAALCADGQPHIEILSPNGGEVYQIGGQMSLGWKTCNISQTNNIWLHLLSQDNNGVIQTIQLGVNDGTQVITLLGGITDPSFTPITPGMYKARIGTLHPNTQWDVIDESDNLFTINAPITDMCPNISGVQTTIPAGMIKDSTGNCVTGGVTTCTPSLRLLSPNGGEVYSSGQNITIRWETSCYAIAPKIAFDLALQDSTGSNSNTYLFSKTDLPNTGSYVGVLPVINTTYNNYILRLFTFDPSYQGIGIDPYYKVDHSDNMFTINPGITNPKTTIPSSVY